MPPAAKKRSSLTTGQQSLRESFKGTKATRKQSIASDTETLKKPVATVTPIEPIQKAIEKKIIEPKCKKDINLIEKKEDQQSGSEKPQLDIHTPEIQEAVDEINSSRISKAGMKFVLYFFSKIIFPNFL